MTMNSLILWMLISWTEPQLAPIPFANQVSSPPALQPLIGDPQYIAPPLPKLPELGPALPSPVLPEVKFTVEPEPDPEWTQLEQQKSESIDRLRLQAQKLKVLWQLRHGSQKLETPQPVETETPLPTPVESQPPVQSETSSIPPIELPIIPEEVPSVAEKVDEPISEPTNESTDEPLMEDEVIVDGPIDRLALATSLYATSRFLECREILEAVDQQTLSIEQAEWWTYLLGCCQRRLKQISEAESHYRTLAAEGHSSLLSESSRWWLDHLSDQAQMQLEIDSIHENVQAWKEVVDDIANEN